MAHASNAPPSSRTKWWQWFIYLGIFYWIFQTQVMPSMFPGSRRSSSSIVSADVAAFETAVTTRLQGKSMSSACFATPKSGTAAGQADTIHVVLIVPASSGERRYINTRGLDSVIFSTLLFVDNATPVTFHLIATAESRASFVSERFKRFERKGCKQCGDIRFETYTVDLERLAEEHLSAPLGVKTCLFNGVKQGTGFAKDACNDGPVVFLEHILPAAVTGAIVLEPNQIVMSDIGLLWRKLKLFSADNVLAMVEDQSKWYTSHVGFEYAWPHRAKGYDRRVMLVDVAAMRARKFTAIWEAAVAETATSHPDWVLQRGATDVFNAAVRFDGSLLYDSVELSCQWNVHAHGINTAVETCASPYILTLDSKSKRQRFHASAQNLVTGFRMSEFLGCDSP